MIHIFQSCAQFNAPLTLRIAMQQLRRNVDVSKLNSSEYFKFVSPLIESVNNFCVVNVLKNKQVSTSVYMMDVLILWTFVLNLTEDPQWKSIENAAIQQFHKLLLEISNTMMKVLPNLALSSKAYAIYLQRIFVRIRNQNASFVNLDVDAKKLSEDHEKLLKFSSEKDFEQLKDFFTEAETLLSPLCDIRGLHLACARTLAPMFPYLIPLGF